MRLFAIARAQDNSDEDSDDDLDESDEEDIPDVLSTDEDEINEESEDYLEALQERIKKKSPACAIVSQIKVSFVN